MQEDKCLKVFTLRLGLVPSLDWTFIREFCTLAITSFGFMVLLQIFLMSIVLSSFSHSVRPSWPHELQHARLLWLSLSPGVCSNSCSLSQWCYLTISSSVSPFSSCPQSFPVSESFPISWFFTSGGQSIASVSASVLPMNIQGWFPLGLTGLIPLLSKGLSRVFSSTIWKHQFFGAQPSLQSSCHIHTWLLGKP